jgi:serine/threonine protein phosphatase PrpC
MADPHVLYVVTAVVVLGLVAWVAIVLARPEAPRSSPAPKPPEAKREPPPVQAPASPPPASPQAALPRVHLPEKQHRLDSHAEIQDEPVVTATTEVVEFEEEEDPTGPNALILVTAVGRTHPGLKRTHNEDAYAILEDHHLFVIADGMGRHAAGEVASQICVDAIGESFRKGDFGRARFPSLPKRASRLRGAILLANGKVYRAANDRDDYAGMGTTVVCAYFSPNNQRVYIAHVGDSRCYRLRQGVLTQLTTDHTLGAAGIQGKTSAILSRAVGVEEDVEVDVTTESPIPGDVYLLCSDGLSRMVSAEDIQSTLACTSDLDQATRILVDKANQQGGRDNITTILVRVEDAKKTRASSSPSV